VTFVGTEVLEDLHYITSVHAFCGDCVSNELDLKSLSMNLLYEHRPTLKRATWAKLVLIPSTDSHRLLGYDVDLCNYVPTPTA